MNCVPGGYEDESSDDDAFIYLNDYQNYGKEEKEEQGVMELVKAPDDFMSVENDCQTVMIDKKGKPRFFKDLVAAILIQDVKAIEEFCENVDEWKNMVDEAQLKALDYAVLHARSSSLATLLQLFPFQAADISLPVAFLYSRGNHHYGEEEEEEENEEGVVEKAQTCVKLLSSLKDVSYDFAILWSTRTESLPRMSINLSRSQTRTS